MSLSRPPAISTIGASKARSAAIDRVGLGALRVVDEADAVDRRPTGSSRCSTPVNAAAAARIAVGLDAESERDGDRGEGVGDVVGARDGQLGDRHDPAARRGAGEPAAGQREALEAIGHDPAVDDAEPARRRRVAAVADGPGASPSVGVRGDDRVLVVQHQGAVRIDQLGQPALDRPVAPRASRGGRGGRR